MNKNRVTYPDSFLEPENMIKLYALGAFPMAESKKSSVVNWYLPEIRTIIPLESYHIPRSLRKTMRTLAYEVRYDTRIEDVIHHCGEREDTWISTKLIKAYKKLITHGYLHSVEIFQDDQLVGGLYGITYKGAFMGESMFSLVPQASKIALAHLLQHLREKKFLLLDVQYMTTHLQMFGAKQISLDEFNKRLKEAYKQEVLFTP
jgi:leucyl/phenylalanyl-tRNA--protein transferase